MKKNLHYYDQQYFKDRATGPQIIAQTIARFLKNRNCKTILDVGCGSGWLIRCLKKRGFQASGCDISDEAVKLSGQVKASATNLPFKSNQYDAVLAISIVEHLLPTDVNKFLRETFRVLKNGGWFFLDTPNFNTPWRYIYGKNWAGFTDPTHINFYTPQSLKKVLQNHGFTNVVFTFPYTWNSASDFGFPKFFNRLPPLLKKIGTFLVLSTPLYNLRHSFWVGTQKTV